MKRYLVVLAFLTAALMAAAQTAATQQPQQQQQQQQQKPQQQQPQQGAQGAALPSAPAQPAPPLPGTKHPPQAKSQEEMKAFQEASSKTNPADLEAAADAFAQSHPDSDLRELLYRQAMYAYQNVNNADKAIEMGRKVLAIDPNNPEALVMTATYISERTRDTDLDKDERLAEATADAQKALQTIDTDLMLPPTMNAQQAAAVRAQMKGMAYGALGTIAIAKKDWASAETNLKQASLLDGGDPLVWLRLAYALDKENKYSEAITPANNCIQYATQQPQVADLCRQEKERVTKLAQTPATPAAAPTSPQTQSVSPKE